MKNVSKSLLAVIALSSFTAFAAETVPAASNSEAVEQVPQENLKLEAARWGGKAAGYVCAAAETVFVGTPSEYSDLNVAWGSVVTDFSLDNGLLLATFTPVEGTTCSYSALMFANSQTKNIALVESRAFATAGEGSCADGKEILDAALASNKYIWKESRKHLTILAPSASAEDICGAGVANVGIDFVFTGKIN